ncbi:MAG: error-prone DNA polymerase [Actinomycetota bacterium]|nr:MAG: error-prone DNA polymerase [Actinomycetota bacterium]
MGFNNPGVSWGEFERVLSGRPAPGDGNDAPAWTRHRQPYVPPSLPTRPADRVRYAELHVHSNFSFLDGASHPHELAEEAARLGLDVVALTDHDGLYGVVQFAEAAKTLGVATAYGAELSLDLPAPQNGVADPVGRHLLVLARGAPGYHRLSRAISDGHARGGQKGRPTYDLDELGAAAGGSWLILTGCRKGAVPQALVTEGRAAARRELDRLVGLFGRDNVAVELNRTGDPLDDERCDALAALAHDARLPLVASGNVHYATPSRARLAAALAAVRARRSLDELDGWLPGAPAAHLRSGEDMAARFARYPQAVPTALRLGLECAFDLALIAPGLPPFPVPAGHSEATYLRELVAAGEQERYAAKDPALRARARARLAKELDMIEGLGFCGYFLIVWEIAQFCHRNGILAQGRGSAVTSAVCYTLGITTVDAVDHDLLFERFLSPEREEGYPDIDLDISSARREEVIQFVYDRYGRQCAAQVANVITYRPRSAVRDMARALGHSPGQQDAWSKQIERWGSLSDASDNDIPPAVMELAEQVRNFPRHLGIHSGGMVICGRPVVEVCPVEWGRMPGRSVLQWDKDDCAAVGLVKFDLLGLGMLTALQHTRDLVADYHGVAVELHSLPHHDPRVYDMLCQGDSVGVFQVESRAQMATLPRLRPRTFYDLVVEIALIRPGPIQGGSVHPYLRRRSEKEAPDPPHPLLQKTLERTLGVPLFQEQLMQMAVDLAGFSPAEADGLRRAMSSKRSVERMRSFEQRLYDGMAARGVTGEVARSLFEKLIAFASYGFPESHAISFAQLVYSSSWFKLYYPAAFCAGLLRSQPMGFYSPQSLVADARRHQVTVRGPDVNASGPTAGLEPEELTGERGNREHDSRESGNREQPGREPGVPVPAVRLGLDAVRHIGSDLATQLAAERARGGPYADLADLTHRVPLTVGQAEALATAGAFDCFGLTRREALWSAGALAGTRPSNLPGTATGATAPVLPGMTEVEQTIADLWATGITPAGHPTELLRSRLTALGIASAQGLRRAEAGRRIWVGGVVTHRQRPATASGITFVNLEDETGMANIICSPGVWARYRRVARSAAAMLVRGRVERGPADEGGVTNLIADRIEALPMPGPAGLTRSRDFR